MEWPDYLAIGILTVVVSMSIFKGVLWAISWVVMLGLSVVGAILLGPMVAANQDDDRVVGISLIVFVVLLAALFALTTAFKLVRKLTSSAKSSWRSRLTSGVFGLVAGAVLQVMTLAAVHSIYDNTGMLEELARAADRSYTQQLARQSFEFLGGQVAARGQDEAASFADRWARVFAGD